MIGPGILVKSGPIRRWSRIFVRYAANQVFIQGLGFVVGILVVRALTVTEYALYSLSVAFIAAVTVVCDSGISSTALSLAGQDSGDNDRVRSLALSARNSRRTISALIITITCPFFIYLILKNGGSAAVAALLALGVYASFWLNLESAISQALLRAKYQFRSLQRSNSILSVTRLIWVLPIAFFPSLGAVWAISANLLAAGVQRFRLQEAVARQIPTAPERVLAPRPTDVNVFSQNLRRSLPLTGGIVLQGQLVYPLLGLLGATSTLASVSAVNRFSVIAIALSTTISVVAAPIIARSTRSLHRNFALLTMLSLGAIVITTGVMIGFHEFLLGLLGPSYSNLSGPFFVIVAGAALSAITSVLNAFNGARSWLNFSWVFFPMSTAWALMVFSTTDFASPLGASIVISTGAAPALLTEIVRTAFGFRAYGKQTVLSEEPGEGEGVLPTE